MEYSHCVLRAQTGGCLAKPSSDGLLHCSRCARVSTPIRVIRELDKIMEHPEPVRRAVADLISSERPDDLLFFLMGTGGFCWWELQGLGRTFEYPVDINFMPPDGCNIDIRLRHAVIDHRRTDWKPLETPPIDEQRASNPVFARLVDRLAANELRYLGVSQRQFVFGRKFRPEGESYDCGLIALVRL